MGRHLDNLASITTKSSVSSTISSVSQIYDSHMCQGIILLHFTSLEKMDPDNGTSSQKEPQYTNPDIEMGARDVDDLAIPRVEMGNDQQVKRTTRARDISHTDGTSSSTTATKKSNRKARDPEKLH
ncbi:3-ketoacyl-CoA synthase 11 [Hordeum vulgare]|nr:3-ketoacyl-CoA synthase 11 [Hordeum vulgare]